MEAEAIGMEAEAVENNHFHIPDLKPLASCRSPTALKRPDKSKQCHYLLFAQSALLVSCITLILFLYNSFYR